MKAMEDHVLDTYRREVTKDGVIDPAKHERFLRNYGPALKQLPDVQRGLDSIGNAAALLGERETNLASARSLLDSAQLDRLKYNDPSKPGLDPRKIDSFLQRNGKDLEQAISSTYGEQTARSHMDNLRRIAKAAEIADRGRLSDNAFPAQSTNPLDMKAGLGFSSRTVFNMLRAVTTGRTSAEDMAFTLGMQSATHRVTKALIAAEERAIQDPQTAKLIAESVKLPANSEAGKINLRKILEKGSMYAIGEPMYGKTGAYVAPSVAANATHMGMAKEKK
jgi:hypothetical protein